MPLKTILWAGFFTVAALGALWNPMLGIVGYVGHYSIGPEGQWWNAPLSPLRIRYSFTLAAMTAIGVALNWRKLRFGPQFLCRHEKLVLLFLGIVWLSVLIGAETTGRYTASGIDHPSVKLTKVIIFTLMLTHVVTDLRKLDWFIWVLIAGALILGLQAWDTPRRAFLRGRLEGVGGPDFSEANFFAAYMATMLWIIGVQFLRSGWVGKAFCFIAGAFTANAIVLTRSRGAMVGLAAGAVAAVLAAPGKLRLRLALGLVLGGAGFLYLADPQFLHRGSTITASEEERDSSAQSRIRLAQAGVQMVKDHPFGVGAGNFYQTIENYIPEYKGKDAHNTYVRCATELGIQGIALLFVIIIGGFWLLRRTIRFAEGLPPPLRNQVVLLASGLSCALATLSACFLTVSLTYVEFVWWFLLLPVCLSRAVGNLKENPIRQATGMRKGMLESAETSKAPSAGAGDDA